MADSNLFTLKIITPDRVFYEGEVSMVEFNTIEGEIGVLKGHIPLTVIVSPGILTITEAEGTKEAALHAGRNRSGSCRACKRACRRKTSQQDSRDRCSSCRNRFTEISRTYSCIKIISIDTSDG